MILQHKLITSRYRVKTVQDLNYIRATSTIGFNTIFRGLMYGAGCIPGCIDKVINQQFLVPEGCIRYEIAVPTLLLFRILRDQYNNRLGDDGNGRYLIFGPGAHRVRSPFYNIDPMNVSIMDPVIQHGTSTIITVR